LPDLFFRLFHGEVDYSIKINIMSSMRNNVFLIGRLGKDPELLTVKNGQKLAKVSLATSDFYKDESGELVQNTQWHNCIAWGKTAELMHSFLKKGKEVAFSGKLTYQTYEDKEGVIRNQTQVVIGDFVLLGKKEE
jgi:single-strand DNA-binding protein